MKWHENHAWAEALLGKKWHFVEACNPDVALDQSWWVGEAKKAFVIYAAVFGFYEDLEKLEDTIRRKEDLCIINVTANYADTCVLEVKVLRRDKTPVPDRKIEYFLPPPADRAIAYGKTDEKGVSRITVGKGGGNLIVKCSGQKKTINTSAVKGKKAKISFTVE